MTYTASLVPVGTRVSWTREVYRVAFKNRPTDHGIVVENDGQFVRVKRDDNDGGGFTFGPAVCFYRENA